MSSSTKADNFGGGDRGEVCVWIGKLSQGDDDLWDWCRLLWYCLPLTACSVAPKPVPYVWIARVKMYGADPDQPKANVSATLRQLSM